MGALSPRLVCMDFAGPWLLQCPKVSEGPCPLPQDAPPTTTDITPEAPPSASHLTPEALLTSPKLPLKRRLDQLDDGVDVPPVKRPNMETVAMETGESSAEEDRVKASLPDPPTSDKEEVVHNEDALTAHLNKEKNMTQTQGVCVCVLI